MYRNVYRSLRRCGLTRTKAVAAAFSPTYRRHLKSCHALLLPSDLPPLGTVIDVGANRGNWAEAARAVLPLSSLHLVEPTPELAAGLVEAFGGDDRVTVHAMAVSDTIGTAELSLYNLPVFNSLQRLTDEAQSLNSQVHETRRVTVPTITLDALFPPERHPEIGLLKLDIQGGEDKALDGASDLMQRVKFLVIEVNFVPHYEAEAGFTALYDRLTRELGFRLYTLGNIHREQNHGATWCDAVFTAAGVPCSEEPVCGLGDGGQAILTDG